MEIIRFRARSAGKILPYLGKIQGKPYGNDKISGAKPRGDFAIFGENTKDILVKY